MIFHHVPFFHSIAPSNSTFLKIGFFWAVDSPLVDVAFAAAASASATEAVVAVSRANTLQHSRAQRKYLNWRCSQAVVVEQWPTTSLKNILIFVKFLYNVTLFLQRKLIW